MRSLKEISDRQIIQIALIFWGLAALGSLIANNREFAASATIAVLLGLYGLRFMRKRTNTTNKQAAPTQSTNEKR